MKKLGILFLALSTISFNPLRSDSPVAEGSTQIESQAPEATTSSEAPIAPEPTVENAEVTPAVKEVSSSKNSDRNEKRMRWYRGVGLALGAIAVATVAIILASKNNGHSSN
jgi:hypothetical protein